MSTFPLNHNKSAASIPITTTSNTTVNTLNCLCVIISILALIHQRS